MNQSVFNQIAQIKDKVQFLLEQNEKLRDDDYKLIATFYFYEAGGSEVLKNKSALDFLQEFSQKKYVSSESIRRVRQKIQEENVHLRGVSYKNRKDEEIKFRNNL